MSRYPTESDDPMLHLADDIATLDITEGSHEPLTMHDFLGSIRSNEDATDTSVDDVVLSTAIAALNSIEATTWDDVKVATNSDDSMTKLLNIIEDGFPTSRDDLPPELREFHRFREHLSSIDGVILYKDRIVIPRSLRYSVIDALHAAHHCVTTMTGRAETSVFWPGITTDIQNLRSSCSDHRAPIAIAMHRLNQVPHQPHQSYHATLSNVSVRIISSM